MSISKVIAAIPQKSESERRQMRANAERILEEGPDDRKTNAQAVIDALEQQTISENKVLYDRLSVMGRAERVIEAFKVIPPTDTDKKAILALLENPHSTSTSLSKACGWRGKAWHMHFGKMCEKREIYLWPAEKFEKRDASFYSGILTDFDEETSCFSFKPDIIDALIALGFVKRAPRA